MWECSVMWCLDPRRCWGLWRWLWDCCHGLPLILFCQIWLLVRLFRSNRVKLCRSLSSNSESILCYLGFGKEVSIDAVVSLVEDWMPFVSEFELRGRNIVASSPNLHLFFTVFLDSLHFVESLQGSIVPLVKAPVLDNWDVVTVYFVCSVVEGLNGPG